MIDLITQAVARLVLDRPWVPADHPAVWLLDVEGWDVYVERDQDVDGEPIEGASAWLWTVDAHDDHPWADGRRGHAITQEAARKAACEALVRVIVEAIVSGLAGRR